MLDGRLLAIVLGIVISLSQFGCAQRPGYSAIRSDRFANETLPVGRIAIIASMETADIRGIGQPLVQSLGSQFREAGYTVQMETQVNNPLALGPDTDFRLAHQFRADAVILIRAGSSYSSTYGGEWSVTFNVLDGKGKGIWRGSTQVRRSKDIDAIYEAVTRQLIATLQGGEVIKLTIRPNGSAI